MISSRFIVKGSLFLVDQDFGQAANDERTDGVGRV